MRKNEIAKLNDTELFVLFHDITVNLVKEENSVRGATKKSAQISEWVCEEFIKRFNFDRDLLIKEDIMK